jgi:hypothetical protein
VRAREKTCPERVQTGRTKRWTYTSATLSETDAVAAICGQARIHVKLEIDRYSCNGLYVLNFYEIQTVVGDSESVEDDNKGFYFPEAERHSGSMTGYNFRLAFWTQ